VTKYQKQKAVTCGVMVVACLVWTFVFKQIGLGQIWLAGALVASLV